VADGVTCIESEAEQLEGLLASAPWVGATMGLSTTNITPTPGTVAADLLPGEVAVSGYTRAALAGWTTPTIDGSNRAVSDADPVTFLNTSGGDTPVVYCWFFLDTASAKFLQAGRFALPFVIPATIGTYTTTPFARLRYE